MVDHAQPRFRLLAQPDQHRLGVGGLERPLLGEGGGQDATLLHHGPLLGVEELALVDVKIAHPGRGQEDEEEVEGQEPDGDPGAEAADPRHPASSR